jgi:polyisoprenoid-binding protein YceI
MTLSTNTNQERINQTPSAELVRYALDATHSHLGFSVRHMMIANVRGEFTKLAGEVAYDAKRPEATRLEVTVDASSINTREEKRDAHLKSADFLDVEQFPNLVFSSTSARQNGAGLEVTGNLTIHGVTREVTLTVEDLTPEFVDPYGNRRLGAAARTKIKRSDFGMRWNAALEAGGVLVGDEISIQVEVELIRQ